MLGFLLPFAFLSGLFPGHTLHPESIRPGDIPFWVPERKQHAFIRFASSTKVATLNTTYKLDISELEKSTHYITTFACYFIGDYTLKVE
ncbi:MAG TPA: hypothetical protein VI112_00890 [Bacteroidia bacterium]|jgi:hypothetical protein